jgi:hypothetical protein
MELTPLDTELVRLHQTLGELVAMGLAREIPGEDASQTRYQITAGRPGDDEEDDQEETPERVYAVPA